VEIHWVGCHPENFRAGRALGLRPDFVVVHIMDGSLAGTDSWFNNPAAKVSAHYGIGKRGDVHQYVEERDTAFHAGVVTTPRFQELSAQRRTGPNSFSVGLEHEGTSTSDWTEDMYRASSELAAAICRRWSILVREENIVLHREIRDTKTCPGSKFDRQKYLAMIAALLPSLAVPTIPELRPPPAPAVTLRVSANLREHQPSRQARIVRILPAREELRIIGFTDHGELVQGNPFWFATAEGNFLWAGATDVPQPGS
jgi:N-acetylmuramoyl-L-alanine amidase